MRDSNGIIIYYHLFKSTKDKYRHNLDEVDRKRRDRRIPRIALRVYTSSPFHYLYDSGNNQAFLNCTGFDHEKFKNILDKICKPFDDYTFDERNGVIRPKINCSGRQGLRYNRRVGVNSYVVPYKRGVHKKFSNKFWADMYTTIQMGEVWSLNLTIYSYK